MIEILEAINFIEDSVSLTESLLSMISLAAFEAIFSVCLELLVFCWMFAVISSIEEEISSTELA